MGSVLGMQALNVGMLDCLVIGNEPTGLWVLEHIEALEKRLPKVEKKPYLPLKIAHLPLGRIPKTPLPVSIAKSFGISLKKTQTIEVVTPQRVFEWGPAHLKAAYPALASLDIFDAPFRPEPRRSEASAIQCVIRNNPEILGFASGIWKIFGKSVKLGPELLVWNTIQLGEYGFWEPYQKSEVETPQIREVTLSGNFVTVHFHEGSPVHARHCILNVSLEDFFSLQEQIPGLRSGLDSQMLDTQAHYPLKLSFAKDTLPQPLRPIVLYFDTEEIPDLSDSWYIETHRENHTLDLWLNARNLTSLEAVLESMRKRQGNFFHHLPYLEKALTGVYPSLSVDSTSQESERTETDLALAQAKRFRMAITPVRSYMQNPRLKFLTPELKCFLPYPYGPLVEASQFARELLGRKHYKQAVRYQNALP